MLEAFKKHIGNNFPELFDNHFLIACSGGLDSIVLTVLCQQAGLQFSLAHCNFGLRGANSDKDEEFVRNHAKALKRPIYVTHFDTLGYVNQHKVSVQMAARNLRYAWFEQLLAHYRIPFVLTAHHANDNLETFLINLSRGTGIDGLTGIPSKTTTLRRPLLAFSREDLEAYAKSEQLEWREDESNADTKYLRNKIRLGIIPKLLELHPTFLVNFQNTQNYLNQTQSVASHYLERLKKELFIQEHEKIRISIASLSDIAHMKGILHGLFSAYGFTEWQNLKDLLRGMSGKQLRSTTHILLKDREFLWLSPLQIAKKELDVYPIQEFDDGLHFPVRLKIKKVEARGDNKDTTIFVQKDTLKYPLLVRKWQKGDYFYPLGLNRKKKLSKFFKDCKMNLFEKNEQWLLCSNDQIVWVIGKRADHRFRVVDATKEILNIEVIE